MYEDWWFAFENRNNTDLHRSRRHDGLTTWKSQICTGCAEDFNLVKIIPPVFCEHSIVSFKIWNKLRWLYSAFAFFGLMKDLVDWCYFSHNIIWNDNWSFCFFLPFSFPYCVIFYVLMTAQRGTRPGNQLKQSSLYLASLVLVLVLMVFVANDVPWQSQSS